MPNNYRGEIELKLDEKIYLLRPTFDAICRIEDALKTSLITLVITITKRALTIREQVTIIKHTLICENKPTEQEIYEFIQNYGTVESFSKLTNLLIHALGLTPKKKK